jgi:hypothetical protein
MLCEKCGLEMRVTGSRNVVTGDTSPDDTTRLFTVLTLECRNPNCSEYDVEHKKTITISNEQPISLGGGASPPSDAR